MLSASSVKSANPYKGKGARTPPSPNPKSIKERTETMPSAAFIEVSKLRKQLSDRLASTKEEMNRKGITVRSKITLEGYAKCLENLLFWLPPETNK